MNHTKRVYQTMFFLLNHNFVSQSKNIQKIFTHIALRYIHYECKILVVGGGTGGCSMAAKFARKFKDPVNSVVVLEPNEVHYYQPFFTLIGGGLGSIKTSRRPMNQVLPRNAKWIKDSVKRFEASENRVITSCGDIIQYDVLIVALGLQINWNQIPGLQEGLQKADSQVCSIYGPDTVAEVFKKIQNTKEGAAVFTYPNTPVKCPGAPQKIVYLTEEYFSKIKRRNNIDIIYNTSLPVIFSVKKYADALTQICQKRNIIVNTRTNLVEINPDKKEAVFEKLNTPGQTYVQKYSLLHVCPPMSAPTVLKEHPDLTDQAGFLTVDQATLRHTMYSNVFGIGDCLNTPNSKTMAAIAAQGKVLYKNILNHLEGKSMHMAYNGYSSCPLVVGKGKCILAEFDYNLQPLETFPMNQAKESYFAYLLKKYFFPFIYWNLMLKGYWNGPEFFRKYTNFMKPRSSG